jgi:hypothetical protein
MDKKRESIITEKITEVYSSVELLCRLAVGEHREERKRKR